MSWIAIVPLKQGGEQKSRLSGVLSFEERQRLTEASFANVVAQLKAAPELNRLVVLSPLPPADASLEWRRDSGLGLNEELNRFRDEIPDSRLLVIHADLPLLQAREVRDFLAQAEKMGVAIAPDRHGAGTNAIALANDNRFTFYFGENSYAKHASQRAASAIVQSVGLSHDVDTPDDLRTLNAHGFEF